MSWGAKAKRTQAQFQEMTHAERAGLTWDEAQDFIEPDTLAMAAWSGRKAWYMRHNTPAEALADYFRRFGLRKGSEAV